MILDYILKVSINSTTIYKKNTCKHYDKIIANNGKIQSYEINSQNQNNISTSRQKILMLTREMNINELYLAEIIGNTRDTLSRYQNNKISSNSILSIIHLKTFGVPNSPNKLKFYSTFSAGHNKEYLKQAYKKFFMSVNRYNKHNYMPKRFKIT